MEDAQEKKTKKTKKKRMMKRQKGRRRWKEKEPELRAWTLEGSALGNRAEWKRLQLTAKIEELPSTFADTTLLLLLLALLLARS